MVTGENNPNYRHGMTGHPVRNSWALMKRRCNNPSDKDYHRYGGRGIKICERWLSFINFRDDMLPSWRSGLTLDRIDTNGNYEPRNCRWATQKEQANNRSSTKIIEYGGKAQSIAEWSRETGISFPTLWSRYCRGLPPKDILFVGLFSTSKIRNKT